MRHGPSRQKSPFLRYHLVLNRGSEVRISERSITALQKVITGDPLDGSGPIAPYQGGPRLVAFFNELGFNDYYPSGGGFPSRWAYCEDNLRQINDTPELAKAIELALDPGRFLDSEFRVEDAAAHLGKYLELDGYQILLDRKHYRVSRAGDDVVSIESEIATADPASKQFIHEQIEKCKSKLQAEDFDGAITNARSLVEAVLTDLERKLDPDAPAYDGNLEKLWKRVRKKLNLDPTETRVSEVLRPIQTGLTSIITGLAGGRNKLGDAHVPTYRPSRHHARLAVNSAKTLVDFVLDSYEYQILRRRS